MKRAQALTNPSLPAIAATLRQWAAQLRRGARLANRKR